MFKKMAALFLLVALSVNMCGCATILSGGREFEEATWVFGQLVQEVDAPLERSIQATKLALKSLNLDIVREIKKKKLAQIISNYTDGKTIWIEIHEVSPTMSRVGVRVGVMFNDAATHKILDEIKKFAEE